MVHWQRRRTLEARVRFRRNRGSPLTRVAGARSVVASNATEQLGRGRQRPDGDLHLGKRHERLGMLGVPREQLCELRLRLVGASEL